MIKRMQTLFSGKWALPLSLVLLIGINWLASRLHYRVDFTNEKRFTLSAPTRKLLAQLDAPITVDVFLKGSLNSGFTSLSKTTEDMLDEFREIAGSNFQYHFINPAEPVEDTEVSFGDTLNAMGLTPINLTSQVKDGQQQQLVYPYALVRYNDQVLPVSLYEGTKAFITQSELNSAEALLEYKFANALTKLTQPQKPMIAYASGQGEVSGDASYDLVENVLRPNYNLFTLDLNKGAVIPDTFKLLLIVKPKTAFSAEAKLKIDQFVMRGGRLLLFVDKLEAEMDSLRSKNEVVAYDRGLELDDLLFKYGVRINNDLLMDLQCDFLPFAVNGKDQYEFLHWNYFPLFESRSNHVITKGLGLVSGRFVNTIDTVEAEGIRKTVLLASSPNARTIATPALISGAENVNAPEDSKFKQANLPAAVLLEGRFRSLYRNRATEAMLDSLRAGGAMFQSECLNDNKIIVVADGDMVLNAFVKQQPIPMGMNPFTVGSQYEYQFANNAFLQNCLDYLLDNNGLSAAKAKDYSLRLLDPKKVNTQKTGWILLNIVAPVLLVIVFGIGYNWWRKRRYGRIIEHPSSKNA
jgi:ABC-2 type transport system permease protein